MNWYLQSVVSTYNQRIEVSVPLEVGLLWIEVQPPSLSITSNHKYHLNVAPNLSYHLAIYYRENKKNNVEPLGGTHIGMQLCKGDEADMGCQLGIHTSTDASTHSNKGVGLDER